MYMMKSSHLILIAFVIIVLVVLTKSCTLICQNKLYSNNEHFTEEDHKNGIRALEELEQIFKSGGKIQDVSDEELEKLIDKIYIVRSEVADDTTKEHMNFFHSENTRYWPYYYYSFPYNYKYGGAWPPGMYSRLYYWAPGYYTGSGLSYHMRPGMGYKYWPRNRWIRHTKGGNQTYYYITNRDEYTHSESNYADTPLQPFGGGADP